MVVLVAFAQVTIAQEPRPIDKIVRDSAILSMDYDQNTNATKEVEIELLERSYKLASDIRSYLSSVEKYNDLTKEEKKDLESLKKAARMLCEAIMDIKEELSKEEK